MSNVIKAGMYHGKIPLPENQISLDRRLVTIKTHDGTFVDVPSVEYVRDLESQILELRKTIGIMDTTTKHQNGVLKRLGAGIRKVESKLR